MINHILNATVTGWRLEMSSMRRFKRSIPNAREPDAPFQVERLDPEAPINLKD